ncbi:hypothetical protein EHO61_07575 [Leptospira fluminis]|uniref:Peptidase C-terminal archaeal/bacterial domain-containing protein n=1 Tax=Leptospira fluminis TaxID=2484979 RepID=A0A4R9GR59_9LEPT|nr:hypothetical protein [Leptospira fluminis]TGK19322.1 hypothetical protein EHO61_07575 [Leptospira fluminis]
MGNAWKKLIFFALPILVWNCNNAQKISVDTSQASGMMLSQALSLIQAAAASAGTAAAIPVSTQTISGDSWTCNLALYPNCENIYDVPVTAADTLSIAVTAVTGTSVVRLAVYAPGSALSGTNVLNGGTTDHTCPSPPTNANQNQSVTISQALSTLGTYRIAVGRDWGSSAGGSGTYTLTLTTTQSSMTAYTKTASNVNSQATGMSCP